MCQKVPSSRRKNGLGLHVLDLIQQIQRRNLQFGQQILPLRNKPQLTQLQIRHEAIDRVGAVVVEVEGIFESEHLLRPDVVQDLELVFGQFFEVGLFVEDAFVAFGDGGDFVEDGLALFGRGLFVRFEAEVDGLDDFVVGEFAADVGVGGPLDDCTI